MSSGPRVGGQVTGRAQKDTSQVHQFAEWKVGQQNTDKKEVDIKNGANTFGNGRLKGYQPHGQFLGSRHIDLKNIAHENPGQRNAENKKQRKIIDRQRNISDLADKQPSCKQVGYGSQQNETGHKHPRQTKLKIRI